jgi:hypothetical protein
MDKEVKRDLGEQPLAVIMKEHGLKPHDLVCCSDDQITHKMVTRAAKGRRLTANAQQKILRALNKATQKKYTLNEVFTY